MLQNCHHCHTVAVTVLNVWDRWRDNSQTESRSSNKSYLLCSDVVTSFMIWQHTHWPSSYTEYTEISVLTLSNIYLQSSNYKHCFLIICTIFPTSKRSFTISWVTSRSKKLLIVGFVCALRNLYSCSLMVMWETLLSGRNKEKQQLLRLYLQVDQQNQQHQEDQSLLGHPVKKIYIYITFVHGLLSYLNYNCWWFDSIHPFIYPSTCICWYDVLF